jgi:hypothetical protein
VAAGCGKASAIEREVRDLISPRILPRISLVLGALLWGSLNGIPPAPGMLRAQTVDDSIYHQWEEAISLRSNGRYHEAVGVLQEIIRGHADQADVLRRAYNQLVFTCWADRHEHDEFQAAREALGRFPDLMADTIEIPEAINDIYAQLRREMFGAVTIRKPDECQVYMNGELVGETPLFLPYIPVGEYELLVVKEGYRPYRETVRVDPDGRHNFEISMSRQRGWGWWTLRIGSGVAASTALGLLLGHDSSGASPEPLPGPPDPPSP